MGLDEPVEDLVIIEQGKCNLYGFERNLTETNATEKLLIVSLPEQSWFGDFQILLDVKSSF